jgi:hypothetical protein
MLLASLQAHEFRCVVTLLDEYAYANDQGFDRITHPWTTRVTHNFESIRTPSNSQRPLTMELTAIFLSTTIQVRKWVRGGEDGSFVVFAGLLEWKGARLLAGGVKMELSLRVPLLDRSRGGIRRKK